MSTRKVLYISGAPRSGTTILGMALGQMEGACDVGELWALWRPAFRDGDACGCGEVVRECPFWLAVARAAVGAEFESAGPEIGRLHREHLGTKRAPRAWRYASRRRSDPDLDRYASMLAAHYRAIAEVSGATVVVDSSKMATDALVASTIDEIDLFVLHLVRDPRGVTWSWQKSIRQPGPHGRTLHRQGPFTVAAKWDAYEFFANRLLKATITPERFRVLRYEDFMTAPARTLTGIATWLELDQTANPIHGNPPALQLGHGTHPVWGNPVRTSRGSTPILLDDEWRSSLGRADTMLVTAATLPWLMRHGYPVFPAWKREERETP